MTEQEYKKDILEKIRARGYRFTGYDSVGGMVLL